MEQSQTTGQPLNIAWQGKASNYIGLSFKVFLLKLLTLGIYHFWGKTEVRKKLWSHAELNAQPLEYTGRGMELFLGFLVVVFVFFLPLALIMAGLEIYFGSGSWQHVTGIAVVYALAIYLTGVAIYSARRYRLSRTQWRGIRGAMVGSAWAYGFKFIIYNIINIGTLFLAYPWTQFTLERILTNETRFGQEPMQLTGTSKPLFAAYMVPWIGMLIGYALLFVLFFDKGRVMMEMSQNPESMNHELFFTIYFQILGALVVFGLVMAILFSWFSSKYYNYIAKNTQFSNGNFALTTTPGGLIWLTLSNFFIVLLSLSILSPVAAARLFGYFVDNLSFEGAVDVAKIEQSQESLSRTGEGLAEGFDIDAI